MLLMQVDSTVSAAESATIRIPLRDRKKNIAAYAIIDAADAVLIGQYSWSRYLTRHGTIYAQTTVSGRLVYMHRLLMGITSGPRTILIDHVDGDGLNNRRANIRFATNGQNQQNQRLRANSKSGFRGVYPHNGRWVAHARINQQKYHLGTFDTPEAAGAVASAFRAKMMPFSEDARTAVAS